MIALIRFVLVMLVIQTIVYALIRLNARAKRRERLEAEWDDQGMTGDRDAHVEAELDEFGDRLSRWLVIVVYVLPFVALVIFIQLTN